MKNSMKKESPSKKTYSILYVIVISFFAILTFAGCATAPLPLPPPEPVRFVQSAPQIPIPKRPKIRRELGSLWSEESHWNTTFGNSQKRQVGDFIMIKIDAFAKTKILDQWDTLFPPKSKSPIPVIGGTSNPNPGTSAPPVTVENKEVKRDTDTVLIKATIHEIESNNTYRIIAADTIRVLDHSPYIYVRGLVREKDLDPQESVSANQVLDLKISTYAKGPDTEME